MFGDRTGMNWSIHWEKLGFLSLILVLFCSLVINFENNTSTNVIGYDEGVYIINATGHYEDTPITHPAGNWLDAIEKGMMRTGDPPGIFFILNLWGKVSMSEQWLRLCPFLFFCIGIITLSRIGLLSGLSPFLSTVIGFLPLASAESVYHSIEIRAYSMELGMTYLAIYVTLKFFQYISKGSTIQISWWILYTLILLIGASSRWSFIVSISSCYGGLLFYMIYRGKGLVFSRNIKFMLLSAIVVYFTFTLFYFMAFGSVYGVTLPFLSDLPRISINVSEYFQSGDSIISKIFFIFRSLVSTLLIYPGIFYGKWGTAIIILYSILFSLILYYFVQQLVVTLKINEDNKIGKLVYILGWGVIGFSLLINPITWAFVFRTGSDLKFGIQIVFWLFDLSLVIIGYVLIKQKRTTNVSLIDKSSSKVKDIMNSNCGFYLIPLLAFFMSISLSYVDLYPFIPRSRVSLYLQAHLNLIIIAMVSEIYNKKNDQNYKIMNLGGLNVLPKILTVTLVVFSLVHAYLFSQYDNIYRGGGSQRTPDVIRKVLTDEEMKEVNHWYISSGEANSFKYHVLYGDLKGKIPSNGKIIIEKWASDKESVARDLLSIHRNAALGDQIVMLTGHAEKNHQKYMPAFMATFENKQRIGEFVQSSMLGEYSLGGEQAYFAVK